MGTKTMEYETMRKMQVHIKFIELDLLSEREEHSKRLKPVCVSP